jgi:hypothetical protein
MHYYRNTHFRSQNFVFNVTYSLHSCCIELHSCISFRNSRFESLSWDHFTLKAGFTNYLLLHHINFTSEVNDQCVSSFCKSYINSFFFYYNILFVVALRLFPPIPSPANCSLSGVVVSVLATLHRGSGFKPGRGDGFLRTIKILSTLSSRTGSKTEGPMS